jgi:ABC-type nitrate/sulfonate/bicarbonate transport system ATPase subunit
VTLGVELVAKPTLLFLDEPTSGLDGQSAYNIVRFLRRLVDSGQAVLVRAHFPKDMVYPSSRCSPPMPDSAPSTSHRQCSLRPSTPFFSWPKVAVWPTSVKVSSSSSRLLAPVDIADPS